MSDLYVNHVEMATEGSLGEFNCASIEYIFWYLLSGTDFITVTTT